MAVAMTFTSKSSIGNSSSRSINPKESYSPASSSSTTLSPESTNSISSPDKSILFNDQHQQQSIRLVDYFVVYGLNKSVDIELCEQILNPFQCSYRCRVLCHYPNEVVNNPFDEDVISRLSMPDDGVVSIRQNAPDLPATHPFLITRLDGTRYYGVALTFFEQLTPHNDDDDDDETLSDNSSSTALLSLNHLIENYHRTCRNPRHSLSILDASKAICLIVPLAHYSTFKRILELLYRMTIEHDLLGLPLEAHLYNILHELYLPSPSISHSV